MVSTSTSRHTGRGPVSETGGSQVMEEEMVETGGQDLGKGRLKVRDKVFTGPINRLGSLAETDRTNQCGHHLRATWREEKQQESARCGGMMNEVNN